MNWMMGMMGMVCPTRDNEAKMDMLSGSGRDRIERHPCLFP